MSKDNTSCFIFQHCFLIRSQTKSLFLFDKKILLGRFASLGFVAYSGSGVLGLPQRVLELPVRHGTVLPEGGLEHRPPRRVVLMEHRQASSQVQINTQVFGFEP